MLPRPQRRPPPPLKMASALTSRPHIVFILADDLGYHGVGYRNAELRTPTMDRLAMTGLRLESFYASSLCAPSRASLLTGRYPHKLQASVSNFEVFWTEEGLNQSYVLLPERLRRRGYRTALVGKWHAGFFTPSLLPTARGFDSFFGFLGGCTDRAPSAHTHPDAQRKLHQLRAS